LLDGVENFGGVAFRGRLVPDFGDAPVRADQKRGPHDSEERFAEELLHSPRAVGFDGLEFGITQQRKIQIVLGREFGLSFHLVAAAAKDDGVEFIELRFGVAKLGRFVDSTGSERFRKEIEDDWLAAEAGESDLVSVSGQQPEVRRFLSYFGHFRFTPELFLY
jgi:hypothetical protein